MTVKYEDKIRKNNTNAKKKHKAPTFLQTKPPHHDNLTQKTRFKYSI